MAWVLVFLFVLYLRSSLNKWICSYLELRLMYSTFILESKVGHGKRKVKKTRGLGIFCSHWTTYSRAICSQRGHGEAECPGPEVLPSRSAYHREDRMTTFTALCLSRVLPSVIGWAKPRGRGQLNWPPCNALSNCLSDSSLGLFQSCFDLLCRGWKWENVFLSPHTSEN